MSFRKITFAAIVWSMSGCGDGGAKVATPAATPSPSSSASSTALARPAPAAANVKVRLIAFNDFHGSLKPPTQKLPGTEGPVGGAVYFATHMKKLADGHPNTLVVAAGDLVGASPLTSAMFHDEPTIDVMNAIGLNVTAMGNHELDEGIDEVIRLKKGGCHPKDGCKLGATFGGAKYEILAANVTMTSTKQAPLPGYVIREVGGVPIGVIGLPLTGTPHAVAPEGVVGLSFADEVQSINALVPEIKQKGAETIVVLIHEGGEGRAPSLDACNDFKGPIVKIVEGLDKAIDVVVSGHTHQLYNCRVSGRPVTSAASFGRAITTIDLEIDPKTKDVVKSEAHNHAVTQEVTPDPTVQKILDHALSIAAPIENRVIGRITETLTASASGSATGESPLGDVIADAQLEATKKLGAKVALVNQSGVRSDLIFAKSGEEREDGLVTYGEAFASQPFENRLVTLTVTGEALASVLEKTTTKGGLLVSQGLVVKMKEGVATLELGGKPLAPKSNVRITTNSFVAEREPALKEGKDRVAGPTDLEALEQYFKAHPKVSPPKKPRIIK